jgi:hypothetical protein
LSQIQQGLPTRRVLLREHHRPSRARDGAPLAHAALQRPQLAVHIDPLVPPLQLSKQRDRLQLRVAYQQRLDLPSKMDLPAYGTRAVVEPRDHGGRENVQSAR